MNGIYTIHGWMSRVGELKHINGWGGDPPSLSMRVVVEVSAVQAVDPSDLSFNQGMY